MAKRLIGRLSNNLKEPFGGQKIFQVDNNYYLENGTMVPIEILISFREKGFILKEDKSERVSDVSAVIPEKVNLRDPENPIKPTGEVLCRVSPTVDYDFAGELLYPCNLNSYYISENGYLVSAATAKVLSAQGQLIRSEFVFAPKGTFIKDPLADIKKESELSIAIRRRALPLILAVIIMAGVVLFGIPFLKKEWQETQNEAKQKTEQSVESTQTVE